LIAQVPLAFSQQLPILPEPSTIPALARTVPIDLSREQPLKSTSTPETLAAVNAKSLAAGEPQALQLIDLDPKLLRAPLANRSQPGQFSIGGESRPTAALPFTVTLEGRTLKLAVIAETYSPNTIDRYVTAAVLNVPGAYARFTVGLDRVVGTLVTPEATYRLLPAGSGQVSVHKVGTKDATGTARYRQIEQAGSLDAAMEQRHIQLERLAQIQPTRAFASQSGRYFKAEGGQLGTLTGEPSAQAVASVLRALADVNYAPDQLQLRIRGIHSSSRGRLIDFQQTIRNIPVMGSNQLMLDATGKVIEITTQFVDPSQASDLPVMSEEDARKAAIREVEKETKGAVSEYEVLGPVTLQYERETDASLAAYYTLALRPLPAGRAVSVHVNAHSGQATVLINPQAFGWRVCSRYQADPGPANPTTCSDSNAWLIWDNSYGAAAGCVTIVRPKDGGYPAGCGNANAQGANNAMKHADIALNKVPAPIIGGGDRTVDVVYQTNSATSAAEYNTATESIVSNTTSTLLRNAEVVWHELGHHILVTSGTNFNWKSTYNQPGREFETAFEEAFGDLISVGVAMNIDPTTEVSYGTVWTYADGTTTQRRLDDPAVTSFYYMSQAPDLHQAGRAISKYFYQVFTAAGLNAQRFLELLLQVGQTLRDFDGSGKIDLIDLRTALQQSVRANETALLNAVNAQFDAMYNNIPPGQQPPPIGVPAPPVPAAAPFPIVAVFTGACPVVNGARTSEWRVDWGAVPYAVIYRVTAIAGGTLWDVAQTPSLWTYAQTNLSNGEVYVQGCNSIGQCGPPSIHVAVYHQPSCNF
jgi:hypothetical protein